MTKLTKEYKENLEKMVSEASPAPWIFKKDIFREEDITYDLVSSNGDLIIPEAYGENLSDNQEITDALFIAGAREAVPALLEEIKRLEKELLTAKKEAWDEGYLDKEGEPSETMIERGLRSKATNPYTDLLQEMD